MALDYFPCTWRRMWWFRLTAWGVADVHVVSHERQRLSLGSAAGMWRSVVLP